MDIDAFRSAVFNNTSGCKVCFRSPDPEDAEFWALTLGTYETISDTDRVSTSFLSQRKTGEGSRRIVEKFKVHPNLLKSLESGTALVLSPGRAECLVRTARVREIVNKLPIPALPLLPIAAETGLDLRSHAPSYEVKS
jgi:hypothetical protein